MDRFLDSGADEPVDHDLAGRSGSADKDQGAENLAAIRKLALNALKRARPDISIRRKRSGCSDAFAKSVIGQMR